MQKLEQALPDLNSPESVEFYTSMQELFKSEDFKQTSSDIKARREQIGNGIYETVEKIIGAESAPKITGMIIDLNFLELIPAVSTLETLTAKVRDAHTLLQHLKISDAGSAAAVASSSY